MLYTEDFNVQFRGTILCCNKAQVMLLMTVFTPLTRLVVH